MFQMSCDSILAASMTGAASAETATNQVATTSAPCTRRVNGARQARPSMCTMKQRKSATSTTILDRSGKVANVILGVGGVLGVGEHYVAVAFELKWVDQPVTSTTASTTSAPANAPATTSAPDGTREPPPVPQLPTHPRPPQPAPVSLVSRSPAQCVTPGDEFDATPGFKVPAFSFYGPRTTSARPDSVSQVSVEHIPSGVPSFNT